jgi:tetratricopeptide (TPR) repeat protein
VYNFIALSVESYAILLRISGEYLKRNKMYSGQSSRRLGLIIGANNYQDPGLQPLQFAENDARALAQWLVNTKGGNWAPGNVQHVEGSHATQELVQSLIKQMCLNIAEKGDLALIYFAGHAFIDEGSGEGYLALVNTRMQDPTTALHLPSLFQNIMQRSQAAHILVILDCFQTGRRWSMQRTFASDASPLFKPALLNTLQSYKNRIFLCSCRGNELLPEMSESKTGTFMHHLILGLCGPTRDPATGTITLQQMQNYLASTLGEQQRPQIFGQDQPPLLLVGDAPSVANNQPSSPASSVSPAQPASTTTTASPFAQMRPGSIFRPGLARSGPAAATAAATTTPTPPAPAQPQPAVMEQAQQTSMEQQRQQQFSAMMNQAQQYLQMQKYPEAFNVVEQALQIMPNDSSALILKSQILGSGGRTQEALTNIEQLLQRDPNNATAWSTRAVLLSYAGQYQPALEAIERSLYLEPNNAEAYGIKNTIQTNLAMFQNKTTDQQRYNNPPAQEQARASAATVIVALLLQIGGLATGLVGGFLLTLQASMTSFPGLLLISAGLLILCANAARGTHRYGLALLFPPVLVSLIIGAMLGAAYKIALTRLITFLQVHPSALVSLTFLVGWLVVAAVVPPLLATGGLISRAIAKRL